MAIPHSGIDAAFSGPVDSIGTLSQTLTTTPGELYTIDFWLENQDTSGANSFSVSFDGNVLDSMTNAAAFGYTEFTLSGIASTSSTVLEFDFFNPPSFWFLDDVSVTPIPEPLTLSIFGAGLTCAAALRRRKKTTH